MLPVFKDRDLYHFKDPVSTPSPEGIPNGIYKHGSSPEIGHYFARFNLPKRDYIFDKNGVQDQIKNEIEAVLANGNWFGHQGTPWRRGFILHGPPGTGKSAIAEHVVHWFAENHGIVVAVSTAAVDIFYAQSLLDKNKRKMIYFPEMESIDEDIWDAAAEWIDLLDNGSIMIGCTNEFDGIPNKIKYRPGRFDSRVLIDKVPKALVIKWLKAAKFTEDEQALLIRDVKNMTPAMIKELAFRNKILRLSIQDAIKTCNEEFEKGFLDNKP